MLISCVGPLKRVVFNNAVVMCHLTALLIVNGKPSGNYRRPSTGLSKKMDGI